MFVIYCLILTAWQWLMSFTCIPVQIEPNKSPLRKRLLFFLLWEISHLSSPSRSCLGRLILISGGPGGALRWSPSHTVSFSLKSLFMYFSREGREGERVGEKFQCERKTSVTSCIPPTGDLAHNPGMCLTGNPTSDLLVCWMTPNPLKHTSQGYTVSFNFRNSVMQEIPLHSTSFSPSSFWLYLNDGMPHISAWIPFPLWNLPVSIRVLCSHLHVTNTLCSYFFYYSYPALWQNFNHICRL